ncbi:transcriptional regulator, AsnC family [Lentzea xinjiangensis]|uniref:Transcriptional regulator, AsnC family n=1 Tax=Lentzea xinjiangensis TaxID=402600 RepID=A0A1H9DZE8_9PSEU|nr:Lrp/AsnC family transcriptional regulator [Lentzea xinjiangensis]SEQ18806.1 transcriptional regulator, AsnC family [Lentzea xinjiangensis]
MDAVDRKILAELQRDGRITVTDLAGRVRLSISRCQRRLRELEREGVIRGYRAVVDAAAIGFGFEALVFVKLRIETMDEFDRALAGVPNVVEAQRLFGSPDYLLRVVTADLSSYQRLYEDTLAKLPGVRGLTSTIVMKQVIEPRPLPTGP